VGYYRWTLSTSNLRRASLIVQLANMHCWLLAAYALSVHRQARSLSAHSVLSRDSVMHVVRYTCQLGPMDKALGCHTYNACWQFREFCE
jgi:hypothetical protein